MIKDQNKIIDRNNQLMKKQMEVLLEVKAQLVENSRALNRSKRDHHSRERAPSGPPAKWRWTDEDLPGRHRQPVLSAQHRRQ